MHYFIWSSRRRCEVGTVTVPISQQRKLRPRSHGQLEPRRPTPPLRSHWADSISPRQFSTGKKSQIHPEMSARFGGAESMFPKSIDPPQVLRGKAPMLPRCVPHWVYHLRLSFLISEMGKILPVLPKVYHCLKPQGLEDSVQPSGQGGEATCLQMD